MRALFLLLGLLPVAATAQPLPPPSGNGETTLYQFGSTAGSGNGADTTEDTLLTFSIPAGTLKATGDRLRIYAGGSYIGSTDTKTTRIRLAGTVMASNAGTTAAMTAWFMFVEIQKVGSNQQVTVLYSFANAGATTVGSNNATLNDTGPIALTVTGANSTNSVAGSILAKYAVVEYLP